MIELVSISVKLFLNNANHNNYLYYIETNAVNRFTFIFYRKYKILNKCRKYGSNSTPLNIKTMYNI